ncbi:Insulin-like growth factor-binding protein-like 1 [Varanus komodoensis]|nr:Insulin-like growth factor-binding protein-like 1 [Varanus komodoensis]
MPGPRGWAPRLALLALGLCLAPRDAAASGAACAPCQPERCVPARCAAPELTARDECGCCERCLSAEGERCGGARGARCGPGLVCVSQRPAEPSPEAAGEEEGTGRCVCKEDGAVCGSDGRSYSSVCALHLHSWRAVHGGRERVRKAHDGECKLGEPRPGSRGGGTCAHPAGQAPFLSPCPSQPKRYLAKREQRDQGQVPTAQKVFFRVSDLGSILGSLLYSPSICDVPAPAIVVPPKRIHNVTGAQVYLSCEVKAVPTPVITWKKVTESPKGVKLLEELPGDRVNVAVQVRGGPSKHESTGWVLINPLTKEDEGVYQCHASNMIGETQAEGNIKVLEQSKNKAHFPLSEDVKRNINNLRYADDTTLMTESEEELKSLLMKEERTKVDFKLNIKKIKIVASGPTMSSQIDGEEMEGPGGTCPRGASLEGARKTLTDAQRHHVEEECADRREDVLAHLPLQLLRVQLGPQPLDAEHGLASPPPLRSAPVSTSRGNASPPPSPGQSKTDKQTPRGFSGKFFLPSLPRPLYGHPLGTNLFLPPSASFSTHRHTLLYPASALPV